jgi:hypothetical protein
MYAWANDEQEQIEMCVEVEGILDDVDAALMTRVLRRRGWYLVPDASYPSLQAYIDASYAALAADVRAYKAEHHRGTIRQRYRASAAASRGCDLKSCGGRRPRSGCRVDSPRSWVRAD